MRRKKSKKIVKIKIFCSVHKKSANKFNFVDCWSLQLEEKKRNDKEMHSRTAQGAVTTYVILTSLKSCFFFRLNYLQVFVSLCAVVDKNLSYYLPIRSVSIVLTKGSWSSKSIFCVFTNRKLQHENKTKKENQIKIKLLRGIKGKVKVACELHFGLLHSGFGCVRVHSSCLSCLKSSLTCFAFLF
jgi:hypothetical protein